MVQVCYAVYMSITLAESIALAQRNSKLQGLMTAEEQHWADEAENAREIFLMERSAETASERFYDYQAWLRDGWQPDHAF